MMKSTANHWRFSSRSLKKSTPARLATSIVAMLKLGNTTTAGRSCKERRRNFAEKKLGIQQKRKGKGVKQKLVRQRFRSENLKDLGHGIRAAAQDKHSKQLPAEAAAYIAAAEIDKYNGSNRNAKA